MSDGRRIAGRMERELASAAQQVAAFVGREQDRPAAEAARRCAARLDPALAAACRPTGDAGVLVLRGVGPWERPPGPTPASWSQAGPAATAAWDALLLVLAAALGRSFGWENQQAGRLVHNIVPTRGHELEQTGASSSVQLSAHTEDAFHPERAHLMLLACVRNPDAVPTRAASVRRAVLSAEDVARLARPTLPILPDDSYGGEHGWGETAPAVSTLWDAGDGLHVRYDPAYTPLQRADPAYRAAYDRLGGELERVAVPVTLQAGDVLVIDNDVAVHGREPFRARYDGTDRWLKRVSVRLADRARPPAEAHEHGYGQRCVDRGATS